MSLFRKLFFNLYYLGSPPWDTGVTPPELVEFISSHEKGRALDLGCGTGTNALALAAAGWEAIGVDFSGRAIRMANRKARTAGLDARFYKDDVLRLKDISGQFDLVIDIGCFHSLPPERFKDYVANLKKRLAPRGTFMLYVFFRDPKTNNAGITEPELEAAFKDFDLVKREDGDERGQRPSSWLWYTAR